MGLKVLQLSDLHIGKKESSITANEIAFSIRDKEVNFVLFTGDIIDGSFLSSDKFEDYLDEAVDFFHTLIEEYNSLNTINIKISVDDVFFIPGNHEINRKNLSLKKDLFDKYEIFLNKFYNSEIPKEYFKYKKWSFLKKFEDQKVILLGFNSANYELAKEGKEKDYGQISSDQIYNAVSKLEGISNLSEFTIAACLHHHFYLIEERDKTYEDISVLHNSESFLNHLSKFNLSLIIHGHKHASNDKRIIINDAMYEPEKIATVISSGSIGKKDVERNYFRFIEIYGYNDALELVNITYKYEKSNFKSQSPIEIPYKKTKVVKSEMLEILKNDSSLYNAYIKLKEIDMDTRANEIISIFDKTVGVLCDTVEIMKKDRKCVFYLLLSAHFRSNVNSGNKGYLQNAEEALLGNLQSNFNGFRRDVLEILKADTIYESQKLWEKLIDNLNDLDKKYLTFISIGVYLAELFISLSMYSEKFFRTKIAFKSDIEFKVDEIKCNIKGTAIVISGNEERRAIEASVECLEAKAHKVISLILKEFEILLNDFDKYFVMQGFRFYYIAPKINKFNNDQLESYSFNAYIPKLIPLLAGESIYKEVEVFARELIQNSIDAIHMRKFMAEEGKIDITIGYDKEKGDKTFEIRDNGCGMNKYILERYFTTIGRSFYKSDDFDKRKKELDMEYVPISQFGIGFLSCFLVGKKVEVVTKYWDNRTDSSETGWFLDVPNYDGCFFIESRKIDDFGTRIKLYEDKQNVDANKISKFKNDKIFDYISTVMVNPIYDINVTDAIAGKNLKIEKNHFIKKIILETKKHKLLMFIPFKENEVGFDFDNNRNYWNDLNRCIEAQYGIFIYKRDRGLYNESNIICSNAGINISDFNVFKKFISSLSVGYFDVFINFNALQIDLDVSREIIKSQSPIIKYIANDSRIEVEFVKLKRELVNKYIDCELKKAPYFILNKLHSEFCYNRLVLNSEDNKCMLKLSDGGSSSIQDNYVAVISILELMTDAKIKIAANEINDEIPADKHMRDFSIIYYKMFIVYYFVIMNHYSMDMAMDMAMVRARAIARDMPRDIDIAKDMARAMARDMDMAMDIAMDIAMAMDRARDRARARARDMARAMDMARDMAMNMAKNMVRTIGKKIAIDSFKQRFFSVLYIILLVCNEHKNFKHDLILRINFANSFFPFFASYFLSLEDFENGFVFDLNTFINEWKRKNRI